MMNDPPDFIDNRDGNTLAQALGAVLGSDAGCNAMTVSGPWNSTTQGEFLVLGRRGLPRSLVYPSIAGLN